MMLAICLILGISINGDVIKVIPAEAGIHLNQLDPRLYGDGKETIPDIVDVHKKALEYAQIDLDSVVKLKKKAKLSTLLPKLQFDYTHRLRQGIDIDINENIYVGSSGIVVGPEESAYKEDADLYKSFGIKAVWSFSELIFSKDLLSINQQSLTVLKERNAILDAVTNHYFERKKQLKELELLYKLRKKYKDDPKLESQIISKEIIAEKETASLDSLTKSWFSKEIKRLNTKDN